MSPSGFGCGGRQRGADAANDEVHEHLPADGVARIALALGQTPDALVAQVVQQGTERELVGPCHLRPAGMRQALVQGVGSVVISGITFVRMVETFGPIRSTMITAVVPSLSALAAVIFLGEPLYWNLLLGLALATVGIVFGVRSVMPATVTAVPAIR